MNNNQFFGTRYVVEGDNHKSVEHVWRRAVDRGFDGCSTTIRNRLLAGATTWDALLQPVDRCREPLTKTASTLAKRRREAGAAIAAAIDARKAELAAAA